MKLYTLCLALLPLLSTCLSLDPSFPTSHRPPSNKTKLYDKYPILLANTTPGCTRAFNRMLIDFLRPPYSLMVQQYGARFINDLGSYTGCQQVEGASFIVANFNLSRLPILVGFGVCLPEECGRREYEAVSEVVSSGLTSMYQRLYNATHFETHFTKSFTTIELSLHHSDEVRQYWKDTQAVAFTVFLGFLVTFLLAFSVIPTGYHFVRRLKGKHTEISLSEPKQESMLPNNTDRHGFTKEVAMNS